LVGKQPQWSLRGDAWIFLADRTSGSIAWIHEQLATAIFDATIEVLEVRLPHVDFAAYLDSSGHWKVLRLPQFYRDRASGANIGRDLIPDETVASRGRMVENAIDVRQGHRQTVDLRFSYEFQAFDTRETHCSLGPGIELLLVVDIA
jgi:hypothetical protein